MAQARHGIHLAEPLNHWLRKAFDSGIGLTSEDLALLQDGTAVPLPPGRYLARATGGGNPGLGRIRISLVASLEDCDEAARRIAEFVRVRECRTVP